MIFSLNHFWVSFQNYYAVLLKKVEIGSTMAEKALEDIRVEYEKNNIEINNKEYERIHSSLSSKTINHYSRINIIIHGLNNKLDFLIEIIRESEEKYVKIAYLEIQLNKLSTEVDYFKMKIMAILRANQTYKKDLKRLVDRHLSDLILKMII